MQYWQLYSHISRSHRFLIDKSKIMPWRVELLLPLSVAVIHIALVEAPEEATDTTAWDSQVGFFSSLIPETLSTVGLVEAHS